MRGKLAANSDDYACISPVEIRKTIHELRVHQIELEMQNEELRAAQIEIDAARARYFDLYDLAPVGYCTLSEKGLILEANLTAATELGVSRTALVGQPFSRFINKDDQDNYYIHRKKTFSAGDAGNKGEPMECELRLVKSDGSFFWAHLTSIAIEADDGQKVCRVVMKNITEYKRAEKVIHTQVRKLTQDQEYALRHVSSLMPYNLPSFPDLNVSAAFIPSEIIGGDVLVIEKDAVNNMLYAAIADCTGHGVFAALEASKLKALIDHFLPELKASQNPAQFLDLIDMDFTCSLTNNTDSSSLSYPTMVVCAVNCCTKTITLANASGELPFIIGPNKSVRQLSAVNGGHLGFLFPQKRYVNSTYQLQPGECILMVSDAARDLMVSKNKPLGNEGLMKILHDLPVSGRNICTALKRRLDELHQCPLSDDYTAICIHYEMPLIQQILLHRITDLETAKEKITKSLERYDYSESEIMSFCVAFNEMYINAIIHGNKNDHNKKVLTDITISYEKAVITITDEGDGFNPKDLPDPTDPERILFLMAQSTLDDEDAPLYHGRGIHMTRTRLVDEIVYNTKGNQVTITKKRKIAPMIRCSTQSCQENTASADIPDLVFIDNSIRIGQDLFLNSQILSKIIFHAANYRKETNKPLHVILHNNETVKNELVGYNLVTAGLITFE